MAIALTVRVTGRVQGVSFRWYALQEARRLGVCGWIRNEPDGSVAGQFEGGDQAVDALVDWCRRGPTGAKVRDVSVAASTASGADAFDIRY
jgi:acylphosphatase